MSTLVLVRTVVLLTVVLAFPAASRGQLTPLNRMPRMMQEYLVQRVRAVDEARQRRLATLQSRHDVEAYVADVQQKIATCFGELPARTPLNAQVTRVTQRDGYHIENVMFESRPKFWVTANVYVPNDQRPVHPAVVGACGHSDNGKAYPAYQAFAQGLVRRGYLVLLYDPIGQGERLQLLDASGRPRRGIGVTEHLHVGNQQLLVGEYFGTWLAWDGIRALDYLLSRPDVDAHRLGITGNSGGGTLTSWLWALDARWSMAAPSCFITCWRRNAENELPADIEQCPPRALELGLDHSDFLLSRAPKPVIILTQEQDYFDVRGSEQAFAELQRVYELFGSSQDVALFTGPSTHGFSIENRGAMYGWFDRVTRRTGPMPADVVAEDDATLRCTDSGQVANHGSRGVAEWTRESAREWQRQRGRLQGDALIAAVQQLLPLAVPDRVPDFRILRPLADRGYVQPHATTYLLETELGIQTTVYRLSAEGHLSRPPQQRVPAVLYVADESSDAELRTSDWLRRYLKTRAGTTLYACDLRGTGESRPNTCDENSYDSVYGCDYFYAVYGIMLGDPYPAQRARDLQRVLQWLVAQGHPQIEVVTDGRGRLPALLAALCSPHVNQLTFGRPMPTFQSIAEADDYTCPLSQMLPRVLRQFDVDDIERELSHSHRLTVLNDTPPPTPAP